MPKLKTKKTLLRRIKITKSGKVVKKQNSTGHLKSKMDSSRSSRKTNRTLQENRGHLNVFKKLLGGHSKGMK